MTVVDYQAVLRGVAESDRPRAVRLAVERTDLGDRALETIGTLSYGYRQRLGTEGGIG